MPKTISKHQVFATLIFMSGGTRIGARGLKDRNPFTQRVSNRLLMFGYSNTHEEDTKMQIF